MRSASPRSTTPARSSCSGLWPPPPNPCPAGSAATGRSTSGAGSSQSTPRRSACLTVCCTTTSWSSPTGNRGGCARPAGEVGPRRKSPDDRPRGGYFHLATSGYFLLATSGHFNLAIDNHAAVTSPDLEQGSP